MANNDNDRAKRTFPQLDSDLIDYSRYNGKTSAMPQQRRPQDHGQGAGGFVPATNFSSNYNPQASRKSSHNSAGQYARSSTAYQTKKKMSGGKKALIAILVVLVVAIGAGGGVLAFGQMKKTEINENLHDMGAEDLKAVDAQVTGKATIDEPFTVLLLGSDAREDDPDMGARTDTIILVRVDPVENNVSMVSIPRDTMVEIDGVGTSKINAAYSVGGAAGAIQAVKKLCGVNIDHYAEVNFENLVGLVDAIGGIDVYVDETIDDYYAGGYVGEGQQHLDGEDALVLARSRAYADGDYTRQKNQRKVILAIVEKALTAKATDLTGLINASTKFVKTDSGIDFDFILSLAQQMRQNRGAGKELNITSATIPSRPAYINDVSYVVADTAGIAALMKIFEKAGDVGVTLAESSIDSDIANAGGKESNSEGTSIYEEYTEYEPPANVSYDTTPTYADTSNAGGGTADTGGYVDAGGTAGTGGGAVDTGGGTADTGGAVDAGGGANAGGAGGGADAGGGTAGGGGTAPQGGTA